jgi:hypothetical protein
MSNGVALDFVEVVDSAAGPSSLNVNYICEHPWFHDMFQGYRLVSERAVGADLPRAALGY